MKLFLHIGTEKTGSSYLQKVCALNRSWLEQAGIYFPFAGRDERRLKKGTISPGNARELAELIEVDAWEQVEAWLNERKELARSRSLDSLLLSHELLFARLAREGVLESLAGSFRRLGIEQVVALLFVRDPVDHAISLYKHRGKSGAIGTVREWISSSYSTATELGALIDIVDPRLICLKARKYRKQTHYLLGAFFNDWLGLGEPPLLPEGLVNPSLTLSEIELLKHIANTTGLDVPLFYQQLLAVPRDCKTENEWLELSARQAVSNCLADFEGTWRKFDRLLKMDGGLDIPERSSTDSPVQESFSFSEPQLQAIAAAHCEACSALYKLKVIVNNHVRPPLGRLKRVLTS